MYVFLEKREREERAKRATLRYVADTKYNLNVRAQNHEASLREICGEWGRRRGKGGCNFQEFSERRSASCFPTGRRRRRAPRRSSDKRGRDPRRTPAHARTYWAARTRVRAHQLRRSDSTHDVTRGPNSALLPVHVRVHAQRDGLLLPVRARLLLLGVLAVRRAPAHPVRPRSRRASSR